MGFRRFRVLRLEPDFRLRTPESPLLPPFFFLEVMLYKTRPTAPAMARLGSGLACTQDKSPGLLVVSIGLEDDSVKRYELSEDGATSGR